MNLRKLLVHSLTFSYHYFLILYRSAIINIKECALKAFKVHHRLYGFVLWGIHSRLTTTLMYVQGTAEKQ